MTWDESLGWGWPDNHVATALVGSPGLLREGTVVDAHYDGYGVLRTIESALGLESLGRFDQFAHPLNAVFEAGSEEAESEYAPEQAGLRAAESVVTRGSLDDTFGRVAIPAAVTRGESLRLLVPAGLPGGSSIVIEALGRAPGPGSSRFGIESRSGSVVVPTDRLQPGAYGAWLQVAGRFPAHAALPITILAAPEVTPVAPGVELLSESGPDAIPTLREGGNPIVHYCRPSAVAPDSTWIGVFPSGTPRNQLTRDNANMMGYWLKTPGSEAGGQCGDAMAYGAELAPPATYDVLLMQDASDGTSQPVGRPAHFTLGAVLPHGP